MTTIIAIILTGLIFTQLCILTAQANKKDIPGIPLFKDKVYLIAWHEYYQIIEHKRFNWITLNFINLQYEDDICCGDREISFILFGLGLRIIWYHKDGEMVNEKEKSELKVDIANEFNIWAAEEDIAGLKNKEINECVIYRTRKHAREYTTHPKKIYIQGE